MEEMVLRLVAEDPREWSEEDYSLPQSTTWRISNSNQLHLYHKQYKQVQQSREFRTTKVGFARLYLHKNLVDTLSQFPSCSETGYTSTERVYYAHLYAFENLFFPTTSVVEVADCNTRADELLCTGAGIATQ
ncbi:hypothetical protein AVEN_273612-1 [Araneus ventricosus]|uniref:Uncharacterized protein n=1 Tax=Araneus ventricosus TaxID=182803 RepID=A0A4Y2JWP5_ARAVE|nr:hypothetical protein AVEN_273612-1 [Araneus ventricosus]